MTKLGNQRATRHLGAGMTMAVVVGLFSYGGYALDQWLGMQPVFLLAGLVLGGVGGFLHVVSVTAPELLPFRVDSRRPDSPEDTPAKGVPPCGDEESEA